MDYINSKTGDIVSRREVMRLTGASVPQGMSAGDYFPILPSEPPVAGEGRIVTASAPVQVGDTWVMGWLERDLTEQEVDQRKAAARDEFKSQRETAVAAITVEVGGLLFQGDETSQTRMTRSVSVMGEGETILWVLADNTTVQVTKDQLVEALRLAGTEQARLWVQA